MLSFGKAFGLVGHTDVRKLLAETSVLASEFFNKEEATLN
jgi:hypothetical protein